MIAKPWTKKNGKIKAIAQNNDILPKLLCQKCGAINGITAIESNIPTNGNIQRIDKDVPSTWGTACRTCPSEAISRFNAKINTVTTLTRTNFIFYLVDLFQLFIIIYKIKVTLISIIFI